MSVRPYILGRDGRRSAVTLALFVLLALGVRTVAAVDPLVRLWPPGPLSGVPYIGFVPLVLLSVTAVAFAYSNGGWLVCIGIVYCGTLTSPLGAHRLLPVPVVPRLVTELWVALPVSVLWGTGAYLLGVGLDSLAARIRRQNPGGSVD